MLVHGRQPTRRSLAAIVAAILAVPLLAVVLGTPAQAANTSGEMLVDTNGDGEPDARRFAGAHRYLTALHLADAYAENAGSPSTVIIASGETQVDAIAAAGLAGNAEAPILLTRAVALPPYVARYIERHNVSKVYVVGGTAVVPDAIVASIEGLGSRPEVERLAGADRYATAAAIGSALGGPHPTWCGSTQRAAILVNGSAGGWADAIAVGPLAYALGLPVLLTGSDALPEATVSFLIDQQVERVVVVGGESAVPASLIDELVEDIGVITTRRIAGDTAAGTAVAIAQEMLDPNRCGPVLGTDPDLVALVNRNATADGITAGPVLGFGLAGAGPVPILLVEDALPTATKSYLESTPEVRDDLKTHLEFVAIGGSAVVDEAVMQAAVAAASTSPPLTASITFEPREPSTIQVTFSDDVEFPRYREGETALGGEPTVPGQVIYSGTDPQLSPERVHGTALDPTLYRINGARIEAQVPDLAGGRDFAEQNVVQQIEVRDRTVVILLAEPLLDGDTISVAGGAMIGANGDRRPLEPATFTVSIPGPEADRAAPLIEIVATLTGPGGTPATTFDVLLTEEKPLRHTATTDIWMDEDGVTVNGEVATLAAERPEIGRPDVIQRFRYSVPGGVSLQDGDVIEVARNTFWDIQNRGNRLTRASVRPPKKLEIAAVSVGDLGTRGLARAIIVSAGDQGGERMEITVEPLGESGGAAGNRWVIYGYEIPSRDLSKPAAISVAVDAVHGVISYTITQGTPTLFDLASALAANDTFDANFFVNFINRGRQDQSDPLGPTDAAGIQFSGGTSRVTARVEFNDVALTVSDAVSGDGDIQLAEALAGREAANPVAGGDDLYSVWRFNPGAFVPDRVVYFTYESSSLSNLPQRRETRVVPAGVATNGHDDGDAATTDDANSELTILRALRFDDSLKTFNDPTP